MTITKQQLQLINRRHLRYPLDVAEKDYYLAEALRLISQSRLGGNLVFKGGTALHHCYLPQHRFSEDLDFTSLDRGLTLETVVDVLESDKTFLVKKRYSSSATIKIERLWYAGILDQPGAVKLEIDRKQNVVLPAVGMEYANVWGIPITVQVMDLREICAEKIRAAGTRARYRDFYDLYLIFDTFGVDFEEAIALLRQKEIRREISPESVAQNWLRAQQEAADDLRSIHCTRTIEMPDLQDMVDSLQFDPISPSSGR